MNNNWIVQIAGMRIVLLFGTALMLSLLVLPFIRRFATSHGLYDQPALGSRRVHTMPTPRIGGIGLVVSFFLSILLWIPPPLVPVLCASLVMFVMGLVDDLRPMRAKVKLVLQLAAAGVAVYSADLGLRNIALAPTFVVHVAPWLGLALSVLIIVGAMNAINMIDGLDGLAGGIVLIGVTMLSYLHFLKFGNLSLLGVSLPLIGTLLGFLKYNTHPASIFMGDGGSNWLGFMVGLLMLLVLSPVDLLNPHAAKQIQIGRAHV